MIQAWLNAIGLLILRVSFGVMMLAGHGLTKFLNFSTMSKEFPDPFHVGSFLSLGMAMSAEFFCSILLILGLFTRLAVIPLIVTMLVAIFVAHGADPWAKKELAACYLTGYVVILVMGSGPFGFDRLFTFRRKPR